LKQHGYKIVRVFTGAAPYWQRRTIDLVSPFQSFKRVTAENFYSDFSLLEFENNSTI